MAGVYVRTTSVVKDRLRRRCGRIADWRRIGKLGQALLGGSDITQQGDRVQGGINFIVVSPHCIRRPRVSDQPLMRRRRSAVVLAHACAVALFSDQLE